MFYEDRMSTPRRQIAINKPLLLNSDKKPLASPKNKGKRRKLLVALPEIPLPERSSPEDFNRSQKVLLHKLDQYLRLKGRYLERSAEELKNDDRINKKGYCHGITLLWLYKMAEGKEVWFYNLIEKIVCCPDNHLEDIEMDIEKFLAFIEWAQRPYLYTHGGDNIAQRDVDKILEVRKLYSETKNFNDRDLFNLLYFHLEPGRMICIRSQTTSKHTIGIFCNRKRLEHFIFDANYKTGLPKQYGLIKDLIIEIKRCLYDYFDLSIPRQNAIPLEIDITYYKPRQLVPRIKSLVNHPIGFFSTTKRMTAFHKEKSLLLKR